MTTRRRLAIVVIVIAVIAGIALVWNGRTAQREARSATRVGDGTSVNGAAGARGVQRIDPATVARGSIAGTVRSPDNAPLAGARVCGFAYSEELPADATREPVCTRSGADGRYRIDQLLPARYEVHAQAATFAPAQYLDRTKRPEERTVRLAAGEARDGIDLTLGAGGVEVRGVVKDIGGGGIAGAWVYVQRGARWGGGVGASATAITDADGEFALWTGAGRVRVYAEADGYGSGEKVALAPGQRIEVLLTPESVLAGRVIDRRSRAPVAGARVDVGGTWAEDRTSAWASDLTDDDGRFRITRLGPARYKPSATAPGLYGQARESVLLGLGQSVEDVEIEVDAVATVTGTVLLADEKTPCARGWVMLNDEAGEHQPSAEVEDGKAELDAVLPGTYKVTIRCEGHASAESYPDVVVTGATSPAPQRWILRDGGTVRGIVRAHDGAPVPLASVMASPKGPEGKGWWGGGAADTREDGTFELAGLAPGSYELTVAATGQPGTDDDPTPVEIVAGETAEVEVTLGAAGSIAGTVIDEDGAAVAQVNVQARGKRRFRQWGEDGAQTLDDGSFRIDGVVPGDYTVVASRDPWSRGTLRSPGKTDDDDDDGAKAKVTAGATARVRLVVERQSGTLAGRVVDGDGAPITDAFVDAERESDSAAARGGGARRQMRWSWARHPVLTDTDGRFTIEKLSKGAYTVRAYRKGGGEALVEHVALGADVTITIARTGSIAGAVVVPGGKPPATIRISVHDKATGFSREESFFRSDGAFAMRDLPAGSYDVTASTADGTGTATAALAEGQHLTGVTITLAARVKVTGRLVAADTGAPLAGFIVHVAALGSGDRGFTFSGPPPTSDADGRFELPSVPSGRVQLVAFPTEMKGTYSFTRKLLTLEGGKPTDVGDIKVPKLRVPQDQPAGDLGFTTKEADFDAEPGTQPIEVAIVKPGGPAAAAGLEVGDVIVSVDGQDCKGDPFLFYTLSRVPSGTAIELGLASGATLTLVAAAPP